MARSQTLVVDIFFPYAVCTHVDSVVNPIETVADFGVQLFETMQNHFADNSDVGGIEKSTHFTIFMKDLLLNVVEVFVRENCVQGCCCCSKCSRCMLARAWECVFFTHFHELHLGAFSYHAVPKILDLLYSPGIEQPSNHWQVQFRGRATNPNHYRNMHNFCFPCHNLTSKL